jgi:hypothetical protein
MAAGVTEISKSLGGEAIKILFSKTVQPLASVMII